MIRLFIQIPLSRHHFQKDLLSNQAQKFKFADDRSVIVTSEHSSDSSGILQKTCSDIENGCADSRLLVNGAKGEIILFNCKENDFEFPFFDNDKCQDKKTTVSRSNY